MADYVAAPVLGIWLLIIAVLDIKTLRVPDVLSLPLIAAGLIAAWFLSGLPLTDHVLGACAGYVVLAGIGGLYFRLKGSEGLGLGDAKLLAAAGAWTGWTALPFILLVASASGLVFALAVRSGPGSRIAFAPHLAAGFFIIWLFGAPHLPPIWR